MGLLDGQRAVVTGSASGIGATTARLMVAEGARIALVDRDGPGAQAVADDIGGVAFVADVRDPEAVTVAFAAAAEALGGLDIVVNNAGIGSIKRLHAYEPAEVDLLFDVNLKGTFNGLRAAVPLLRASGGGSIVNMASVSGLRPTRGEARTRRRRPG